MTVQCGALVAGVSRQSRGRRDNGSRQFNLSPADLAKIYWPAGVKITGN